MEETKLFETFQSYMLAYENHRSEIAEFVKSREISVHWLNGVMCVYCRNRLLRMRLFVFLLNNNFYSSLNNMEVIRLFHEVYIYSDNIYSQIKEEDPKFDIVEFLSSLGNQTSFIEVMDNEEKSFFDYLPEEFIIYRGMCDKEKQNGVWGISWTCNYDYACNYPFYPPNKVTDDMGWVAKTKINKSEILTIIGEQRKLKEIVIRPRIIDEFIPFPRVKDN